MSNPQSGICDPPPHIAEVDHIRRAGATVRDIGDGSAIEKTLMQLVVTIDDPRIPTPGANPPGSWICDYARTWLVTN